MSSEGLMAVADDEGDWIVVVDLKMEARLEAILGICDVPPHNMT